MTDTNHTAATEEDLLPQEVTGVPHARFLARAEVADGDSLGVEMTPGRNEIAGVPVRILTDNGSMPPAARAAEAAR